MEAQTIRNMFASIANRYDVTNSVLSLGIHHLWRRSLLAMTDSNPDFTVLDLCTGTGDFLPLLKKRFGRVVGVDFCLPMLQQALVTPRSECGRLIQGDALALPFADASFDVITVGFGVRNFTDLNGGLSEMRRVLKPGGRALILEFGQPANRLLKVPFDFYSSTLMPAIGGMLTGNRAAYEYLPATSRAFPCANEFVEILRAQGYGEVAYKALSGGIAYAYSARKIARDGNYV